MPTLKKDILQDSLEAFEDNIVEMSPNGLLINVKGKAKLYGIMVRAAAKAGWFDKELTNEEIGNMKGRAVVELGAAVDDLYSELVNIPE